MPSGKPKSPSGTIHSFRGRGTNQYPFLRKVIWQYLSKLKVHLLFELGLPLLSIHLPNIFRQKRKRDVRENINCIKRNNWKPNGEKLALTKFTVTYHIPVHNRRLSSISYNGKISKTN